MMKRAMMVALSIMLVLAAGAGSSPARAEVSFDFFYSNLSPHGSWQVSARYGRVWQPAVYAADWNPYYDGHWVYADVGWTWVSDYEWGAVPYHYGTWVEDPAIGWVWVPGYVWAPSWVVFRTGPDFIGWAPVSPGFTVGVSASFGARAAGPFVFVSAHDFLAPRVRTCIVPESRTTVIINNTRVVNTLVVERNVVVNRGPDVRIIERASGRKVREVPIERVSGVGPGRHITREQIAVAPHGAQRGLRVAQPVPVSRPLPSGGPRMARERAPRRDGGVAPRVERQDRPHAPAQARVEPAPQNDHRTRRAERPSAGRPDRPASPRSQLAPNRERPRAHMAPNGQPARQREHPPQKPDHEHGHHQ